jgi:hypothetical protein
LQLPALILFIILERFDKGDGPGVNEAAILLDMLHITFG